MKLYVVRHGETDWNKRNQVQGATDNPLNETGLKQADQTGKNLADIQFTRIYASPLIRARQTAEAINAYQKHPVDIIIEPAIVEQNFGIYEGWPRDNEEYQKEKHKYFARFENGESLFDVAARVYPFLEKLEKECGPDDVVLLSAHGGISRMAASRYRALDNEQFINYFAKNCEADVYDIPTPSR